MTGGNADTTEAIPGGSDGHDFGREQERAITITVMPERARAAMTAIGCRSELRFAARVSGGVGAVTKRAPVARTVPPGDRGPAAGKTGPGPAELWPEGQEGVCLGPRDRALDA